VKRGDGIKKFEKHCYIVKAFCIVGYILLLEVCHCCYNNTILQ